VARCSQMRSALEAELHECLALVADDRVQAVAPIEVEVHCTLEQIFNGGTEKVYIERKVLQRMGYVLERKVCADKRRADGSIGCGASARPHQAHRCGWRHTR